MHMKQELVDVQNITKIACFRNEDVSRALSEMVVELQGAIQHVPRDLIVSLLINVVGVWGTAVSGVVLTLFKKKTEHLD